MSHLRNHIIQVTAHNQTQRKLAKVESINKYTYIHIYPANTCLLFIKYFKIVSKTLFIDVHYHSEMWAGALPVCVAIAEERSV